MVIKLLRKLEQELDVAAQTPPSVTEQHYKANKEQHTSAPPQKRVLKQAESRSETHTISTFHTDEDKHDKSERHIDIDDSDYDIYELLMDSDYDDFQPEDTPTPHSHSLQLVENKSKTSIETREIGTSYTMDIPATRFLEERRFLGLIRKHASLGHPTEFTHYTYPTVRIYPEQQIFAHTPNHELPLEFFTAQANSFSSHVLTNPEEQTPLENWNTQPLWLLYYLAALHGSEGQLKQNARLHDRLTLKSKPDFGIIPDHLDHRTIADFMMNNESHDLFSIADGSDINIKSVIDFCNACEEIGIIERTAHTDSGIRPSTTIAKNKRSKTSAQGKNTVNNMGLLKRFMAKFKHSG
jgi:hypothetical protein